MPGEPFFIDAESRPSALRLNFSHADAADVERGIAILADLVEGQIN
jgi:DNA-binding transcriptional MocR family regulator